MSQQSSAKTYPIEEALRAQKAMRAAAGLAPELFSIPAFVGMVSDEIEALRKRGYTDEQIARTVSQSSTIEITAAEIAANYASPADRHPSVS
jgi:alkylhydroperoxidase family enzyme